MIGSPAQDQLERKEMSSANLTENYRAGLEILEFKENDNQVHRRILTGQSNVYTIKNLPKKNNSNNIRI